MFNVRLAVLCTQQYTHSHILCSTTLLTLFTQDGTGVSHLGSNEAWAWSADRYTPSATLCTVYNAWVEMIAASDAVPNTNEPFRYDLVNTGREILAQVTPHLCC